MKGIFRYIFILILIIFFCGCEQEHRKSDIQKFGSTNSVPGNNYFISTSVYNNIRPAEKNARILKQKTSQEIYIDTLNNHLHNRKYIIRIGPFKDAYSAGEEGYYLYRNKYLSAYSIIFNKRKIIDPFTNFSYIALYDSIPALFLYNIISRSSSLLWHNTKESVIELTPSRNQNNFFAVTTSGYGHSGALPYINGAKLYLVSVRDKSVHNLFDFGNGLQLVTNWMSPNLYKVVFNSLDPAASNSINEHTLVFNSGGNKISEETKRYDIIKESYPAVSLRSVENKSEDNKYDLIEEINSSQSGFYIYDNRTNKKLLVYKSSQRLRKAEWSKDSKFVAFSTSNLNSNLYQQFSGSSDSSQILVFSLETGKIVKLWKNEGNKNFFLRADMIFLDYNSGSESYIIIYNFRNNKLFDTIKNPGGCGFSFTGHR